MLLSLRYRLLCGLLRLLVRCGVGERDLEAAVLRHQLKIRRRGGVRLRFTTADRSFLAAAARSLSRTGGRTSWSARTPSPGGTESSWAGVYAGPAGPVVLPSSPRSST